MIPSTKLNEETQSLVLELAQWVADKAEASNSCEAVVNALAKAKDESAGLFSPMLIVQMDEV